MNNANYWRAKGLAYKIAAKYGFVDDHQDIVHDAYVVWFNKTKRDLFSEHEGTIFHVIKNLCYSRSAINKYMHNGEWRYRSFVYIPSTDYFEDDRMGYIPSNPLTNELSFEEIDKAIRPKLDARETKVYNYLQEGYRPPQIAEKIGSYRQKVIKVVAQIAEKTKKVLSEQY